MSHKSGPMEQLSRPTSFFVKESAEFFFLIPEAAKCGHFPAAPAMKRKTTGFQKGSIFWTSFLGLGSCVFFGFGEAGKAFQNRPVDIIQSKEFF